MDTDLFYIRIKSYNNKVFFVVVSTFMLKAESKESSEVKWKDPSKDDVKWMADIVHNISFLLRFWLEKLFYMEENSIST